MIGNVANLSGPPEQGLLPRHTDSLIRQAPDHAGALDKAGGDAVHRDLGRHDDGKAQHHVQVCYCTSRDAPESTAAAVLVARFAIHCVTVKGWPWASFWSFTRNVKPV